VLAGKVYRNKMIDLSVSNVKLFERSLQIVEQLAHVERAAARRCLLASIYSPSSPCSESDDDIGAHIRAAQGKKRVVPAALLLALNACTDAAAAQQLLEREPMISRLIAKHIGESQ
jgi:C-terminal lid domain of glucokinase regulatory protein